MRSTELARLDATAQAELVARGELAAAELLEAAAARFERLEPLLRTTASLDPERARSIRPAAGPFYGVPFLLKDTTPYPGLRWALGSRLLRGNMAAPPTPFGARVDAAGLVVIGRSAMSEMGLLGSTETLAGGITHNRGTPPGCPRTPSNQPDAEVKRAHDATVALVAELGHHVEEVRRPVIDAEPLGDAFFLVAVAAVAGLVQMVSALRGQDVRDDELEPFSWTLARRAMERGPAALAAAREEFARAARAHLEATAGHDVILTPVIATQTWRIGHLSPLVPADELIRRTAEAVAYTPIHNIAGAPAMSVPLHSSPDGLPIGAHVAARPGHDATLLALAYELEAARPWADRWPAVSAARLL